MRRFSVWLVLSGLWVAIAAFNVFTKQSGAVIQFDIFVAVLFAVLGITQYLHDEKGIIGRTLMGIIIGTAVAAVIVVTVFVSRAL